MDESSYDDSLSDLRKRIRNQKLLNGMLTASVLLALVALAGTMGSEKVVVTPPNVTKTFWVSDDKVSASYLEQMAGYVSYLILDISPGSADWKTKSLLEFVVPEAQAGLKIRQKVEVDRLKKLNGAQYFETHELRPDEDSQSVVIIGRLKTMVNSVKATDQEKTYLAEFAYKGGRTHLKTFEEVDYDKRKKIIIQRVANDRG